MKHSRSSCSIPPLWAVALAAAVFCLAAFWVVTAGGAFFDWPVYNALAGLRTPGLTAIVTRLTHLGGTAFLTAACAVAVVVFWRLWGWQPAVATGANLALASACNWLLKNLVQRPRPAVEHLVEQGGYSFPSGHSCCSMVFYGLLIILVLNCLRGKKRGWLAAGLGLLIMAIGLSRIYVGVHYASDVLAGLCGGFVWLGCFTRIPWVQKALAQMRCDR